MSRFPTKFGRLARGSAAILIAALLATGCNYGFQGGGGFPSHVQTVYIEPFENETVQFDLGQQIFSALMGNLPNRLGVRPAGREVADAVVQGRIVGYDDVAENYRSGQTSGSVEVVAHRVRVRVAIEIREVRNDKVLWRSSGVTGEGTYRPGSETERAGRQDAIEDLVQEIIDGAQSQW